jgi:cyanophycin synthetase
MKLLTKLRIRYYKLERLLTRPVRKLVYRRWWHKDLPVAMITGSHGKTTTSRMLANILTHAGHTVGLACSDGVFINGVLRKNSDGASYYGARRVLNNPMVTAAVLETGAGGVNLHGLYVDKSNVSGLLNVFAEHIGEYGVKSGDHLVSLKRQVTGCAQDAVVLNAQDETCVQMIDDAAAADLIMYALESNNAVLNRELDAGATALTVDAARQHIVLKRKGDDDVILATIDQIPATSSGLAFHIVENAMAAAGLAIGLGVDTATITAGLHSTDSSVDRFATRFNVINDYRFQLVIDKALGSVALKNSLEIQDKLEVAGKRYCLLTTLGNKSDEVMFDLARLVKGKFDRYYVYEVPGFRRGKPAGDTAQRYVRALTEAGIRDALIVRCDGVEQAFRQLAPVLAENDLVFAQYLLARHLDQLAPTLEEIAGNIPVDAKKAAL